MAGLFDTLALGSRSLSTYRKAIDTTGHNLANVNTPGYTRQRLVVETVTTEHGTMGQVGMGAEATKIVRLQNEFANKQLTGESSIEGSLTVKEEALQQALTSLQETINRNGVSGTSTTGISQGLADFFAAAQSLSAEPGDAGQRLNTLQKAQDLAGKFNLIDARLASIEENLSGRVQSEVGEVNALASEIANLNASIMSEEALSGGYANDLRDTRQLKLEELSKLVKVEATEQENGSLNLVVSGSLLVEGPNVSNTLETFDPGDGRLMIQITGQAGPLALAGGSIEGAISVRDGEVANVRAQINSLAESFITEVNQIHSAGFGKNGTTGANFFTGSNAGDIAVNASLLSDPDLLQAAAAPGASGDNVVALAIAQLRERTIATLGGQTFSGKQAQTISNLGQEVASAKTELQDQQAISQFIRNQRDAVSGVSVDEEMTNLIMFQKAFQASAKLITMTDEMLATIIEM